MLFLSSFIDTASAQSASETSTWTGSYSCQEGRQNVTVQMNLDSRGRGDATLFFTPVLGSSYSTGSVKMSVRYTKSRAVLHLKPKRRIKRPNRRNILGFLGAFTPGQARFNARVRSTGCQALNLVKQPQTNSSDENRAITFPAATRLEDLTAYSNVYWRGSAFGERDIFDVVVKFDNKGAQVVYEPNYCKGQWKLVRENPNNFQFNETISTNTRNCFKSGRVHITKEANGRLGFHWRESENSKQFKHSTFLDPVQGHHPSFSKNRTRNGEREIWSRGGIQVGLERRSRQCARRRTLVVHTKNASDFQHQMPQLTQALSASITNLALTCNQTAAYEIVGKVQDVAVFSGALSLNGNWQFSVNPAPLELEARKLSGSVRSFDDLAKIETALSKYLKITGIKQTPQYTFFQNTAKQLVSNLLARNNGLYFDQYLEQTHATVKSTHKLKWQIKRTISSISAYLPSLKGTLEQKLEQRIAKLVKQEWEELFASELSSDKTIGAVLATFKKKAESLPPEWGHGLALDQELKGWLTKKVGANAAFFDEDYTKVVSKKRQLLNQLESAALPKPFVETNEYRVANISLLQSEITKIDTTGFVNAKLEDGDIFESTLADINSKTLSARLDPDTREEIDAKLHGWIAEEIELYESFTDGGFLADVSERVKLADALGKVKLPKAFPTANETVKSALKNLRITNKKGLAELLATSEEIMALTGESYEDIESVFEEGLNLASQFENNGFPAEAKQILAASGKRIENLIEAGHQSLKAELASTSMSREIIAAYQEQSNVFDELSSQFEGFKSYVEAIEQGIAAGRQRECAVQVNKAFGGTPPTDVQFVSIKGLLNARELACDLYRNDHILTEYKSGWIFTSPVIKINLANGTVEEIKLQKDSETDAYAGASRTANGENSDFTPQSWRRYISDLTIPPPTGKPNAQGVTECDLLAADPRDSNKVADGVDFSQQNDGYDFDRATDACIAAIEYAPDQPRHYYQLARVLNFLGMEEEAQSYAEVGRNARYAPAFFLSAEMKMADESEEAFFDAIDYLKEGSKLGYAPAKTLLAELVPPGTDFFRPLPDPSDQRIIDSVGRRKCTPEIFGVQTCITRQSVHSKDCFQTGEKTFSCEVRFRISCKVSSTNSFMNQGGQMRLFSGILEGGCAANPITEPSFETVRVR